MTGLNCEEMKNMLTPEEIASFNLTCDILAPNVPQVDPDNHNYTKDLITFYLIGIGGMTVCILGLIGNIVSLVVLSRKSMRLSTHSYLSALSFCDSLVLVFTIILLLKDLSNKPAKGAEYDVDDIHIYLFRFVHPLAFTFQVSSIWLTLSFTVDRYIMICHPFTAEPYCTISRARKVIAALIIASIIFNIPKFFEYKTGRMPDGQLVNDLSKLGHNDIFKHIYHSGFYIAFVCGLPFVTLAILNAFLMHQVRLSRKRGREICADDKKRNDTTIMLIGVVVVFFICQMPALVSRTIWATIDEPYHRFQELPLFIFNEICTFLIVLNSAINIVPYYFFGKKFRAEFWKLMCSCLLHYKRIQSMTRSFSLTQLDNPNAVGGASRNHSVVSTHTQHTHILNRSFNNGDVRLSSLAPPVYNNFNPNNTSLVVNNTKDINTTSLKPVSSYEDDNKNCCEIVSQSNKLSTDSAIVIVDDNYDGEKEDNTQDNTKKSQPPNFGGIVNNTASSKISDKNQDDCHQHDQVERPLLDNQSKRTCSCDDSEDNSC